MTTPDRIEKRIVLRAKPDRVWRALSNSREFGAWFGCDLRGEFVPGAIVRGPITHPGYQHLTMEIVIERMDSERLLAFRWHPFAVEPGVDYCLEPTTLVEFRLEPAADGTLLVVIESGFDGIPAGRRPRAFEMNSSGWAEQIRNIERFLAIGVDVADRIARSPAEVYDAIIDPRRMAQYFISGASGPMVAATTIEWRFDNDATLAVAVTRLDPAARIEFEWSATGAATAVTIALSPDDRGGTRIAITETGWPMDPAGVKHALGQTHGWTDFCCCLKAYLQHGVNLRSGRPAENVA